MSEKHALHYVLERYDQARDYWRDREKTYAEWYDLYHCAPVPRKYIAGSKVNVPVARLAVDNVLPFYLAALIDQTPWFRVSPAAPTGPDDYIKAWKFERLLQFFCEERMYMQLSLGQWLYYGILYGTAPALLTWKKRFSTLPFYMTAPDLNSEERAIIRELTGLPAEELQDRLSSLKRRYVEYDAPFFEPIEPWNYFPEPGARLSPEWEIIRSWKTKAELKAEGIAVDEEPSADSYSPGWRHEGGKADSDFILDAVSPATPYWERESWLKAAYPPNRYEVLTFFGKYVDEDGTDHGEVVIKVLNRKKVIFGPKQQPLPFRPTTVLRYRCTGDDIWGTSLLEPMRGIIHHINLLVNLAADRAALGTLPAWLIEAHGFPRMDLLQQLTPGTCIPVTNIDSIRELPVKDLPRVTEYLIGLLLTFCDRLTGLERSIWSAQFVRQPERTATEVSIAAAASEMKLGAEARMMQRVAFRNLGEKLALCLQYLYNEAIPVVTEEGDVVTVVPGDLIGRFRVSVNASSAPRTLPQRAQALQAFLPILVNIQQMLPPELFQRLLLKTVKQFCLAQGNEELASEIPDFIPPQPPAFPSPAYTGQAVEGEGPEGRPEEGLEYGGVGGPGVAA